MFALPLFSSLSIKRTTIAVSMAGQLHAHAYAHDGLLCPGHRHGMCRVQTAANAQEGAIRRRAGGCGL